MFFDELFISCLILFDVLTRVPKKKHLGQIYLNHHPNVSWLLRSTWFQWHGPSKTEDKTSHGTPFACWTFWNFFNLQRCGWYHMVLLEEGPPCQSSGSHLLESRCQCRNDNSLSLPSQLSILACVFGNLTTHFLILVIFYSWWRC